VKLALATTQDDPRDPRSWSGTPWSIHQALLRRDDVLPVLLGPVGHPRRVPEAIRKALIQARGQRYFWEREPRVQAHSRRAFADRLAQTRPDAVLALGPIPGACVPPGPPTAVFLDATWVQNEDYYPTWTPMSAHSARQGRETDRKAYERADLLFPTSEWCAASLRDDYGVPAEKVHVVHIGAQHVCPVPAAELPHHVEARKAAPLRLLWIGVEWDRKGGDTAVGVARSLHDDGYDVRLDICGLDAPASVAGLPFVHSHGFLDRRTHGEVLDDLFLNAYALLLPSTAENTSVVIADAASYAVPSLVSDTGGMRAMVDDGATGAVLPLDGGPEPYADVLRRWWDDPNAYATVAAAARRRFDEVLNFDTVASLMVSHLAELTLNLR
jgi:glycosyltransferase involved in cell wall biosynthesis